MTAHGGRFQAQGEDIQRRILGGVSSSWDQDTPATKTQGRDLIQGVENQCSPRELAPRREPFKKARQRVASMDYDVDEAGIPYIRSFYCKGAPHGDMRVDVEINRGRAWMDDGSR